VTPKQTPKLGDVQETMMIPLWARAVELKKRDPILRDESSQRILDGIDFDFRRFRRAKASQIGCCLRSAEFDRYVTEFIQTNPHGTVVDIGAGLNDRRSRVDNGTVTWIDIDLPDSMQLRQEFFSPSDRHHLLSHSIADDGWISSVKELGTPPYFFILEGVMMYLTPSIVNQLFVNIARDFPGSLVCFDTLSDWALRKQRWHDSLKHTGAEFSWALKHPNELQQIAATITPMHQMPMIEIMRTYRRHIPWLVAASTLLSMRLSRRLAESFWFLVVKVDAEKQSEFPT